MASRVYNGHEWVQISESDYGKTGSKTPLAPILDGDGKIFVSIPSYRDGKRCGQTLIDIFQKARDPGSIVIGLIDQTQEEDENCIESYCKELGFEIYKKSEPRKDTTTKVIVNEIIRKDCPRVEQIRKLSVHHYAAKGPTWARSLGRKLLGNEEFCLQIDSHMKFVQDWDEKAKQEWASTRNEFGIISYTPMGFYDMDNSPVTTVPRGCDVEIMEVGIPLFIDKEDRKVENLKKPMLAHTWSSGFSFAKCHLEESAPYDPFTPYIMGVEQFARFARFWTRGYDVYTPTQKIVYNNYQPNPDGHNVNEWSHPRDHRYREASIKRIKSYLRVADGFDDYNLGNLGLYGLGLRRSIEELEEFMRIDLATKRSRPKEISCIGHDWIPYDINISPTENLFNEPDDLDPQPEYPHRTELIFYQEEEAEQLRLEVLEGDILGEEILDSFTKKLSPIDSSRPSPFPSASKIVSLWLLGLVLWFLKFFQNPLPRMRKASSSKDV